MIQGSIKGDQKVLGQIYREYRSEFIAWMCKRYGCGHETARDVYQNTILTLSLKARKGELDQLESTLKSYIYGIAKNKYREYLRSNNRYVQMNEGTIDKLTELAPENRNEAGIQLVRKSLEKLGEPCKSVLEAYYFHGMSMEEIKDQLAYKNSNTVKSVKYKCLLRLREIFQKDWARLNEDL